MTIVFILSKSTPFQRAIVAQKIKNGFYERNFKMSKETSTEKLLTVEAVAEMLSLSKRAVFRMKSAGLICPSIKVGQGAVRFRQSDIELWIKLGCPNQLEFKARKGGE